MPASTPLSITHHFASLPDPRVARTRRHKLSDILVIALCAVLADADSWYEIEDFGKAKEDWFRTFLELPNGIPSHDTFNRVFSALGPQAFQNCFTDWINAICSHIDLKHYCIDGKAHKGSHDRGKGLACLHTVSVWAAEHGLSLGQLAVDGKSNEITAIPALLRLFELEGALVTIDAMGCQKEIAFTILEQGGEYLLQVKGNQPTLYQDIQALLDKALEEDYAGLKYALHETEEEGHGRKERRSYLAIYDPPGLSTKDEWPSLHSVLVVAREREEKGAVSNELAFYISSSKAGVKTLAGGSRGHWGIENRLHWVLDVAFAEDKNRTRSGHAAENLGWLRRVAVSLLKQDTSKASMQRKRKRAGWDTSFLEHLLDSLSQL